MQWKDSIDVKGYSWNHQETTFFLSRNVLEVITDFLLIAWLIDLMYIWVKQIIKKYRKHRVGICLYPPIVDWMESYINACL